MTHPSSSLRGKSLEITFTVPLNCALTVSLNCALIFSPRIMKPYPLNLILTCLMLRLPPLHTYRDLYLDDNPEPCHSLNKNK